MRYNNSASRIFAHDCIAVTDVNPLKKTEFYLIWKVSPVDWIKVNVNVSRRRFTKSTSIINVDYLGITLQGHLL